MPRKPKPLSAPGVPTGLTATPGNMLINLAWNAPASNGGSAITAYRLYRNDQMWHQTAGARFYLDNTSLVAGSQYRYRVSAVNAIGEGGKTAEVSVTAINTNPPPVYTVPAAPASLTATGGNGLVNLTWTAGANGGTAITGYRVYRNGASLIVLGNVLTYQNTGLSNGIPYSYQVAAINAVGEGPKSVSKTATPGDVTPPIVSGITHSVAETTATVSWSVNEPATGQVEYGPTTAYGSTSTFEPGYLLYHNQTISGLTPGIVYHYRAKSLDVADNPGYSSDRQFQTAGTIPLGTYPPDTTLAYIATPGTTRPAYLVQGTDPTFGTQIIRIADQGVFGGSYPHLRHAYAKVQPWSATGLYYHINFGYPGHILNGRTFARIRGFNSPSDSRWSNVNDDIVYGTGSGNQFVKRLISTDVQSAVHTFSGYSAMDIGHGEGNLSLDDRYVALMATKNGTPWIIVYDIANDVVISETNFGATTVYDCTISPSGNYVVVSTPAGLDVYNRAMVYQRKLTTLSAHYDIGYNAASVEIAVTCTATLPSFRLDNAARLDLYPAGNTVVMSQAHVSLKATSRRGWALVSYYNARVNDEGSDQVFAIKTDGSGTVEVFAHAHHNAAGVYDAQPQAVPSHDMTRVAFASEWDQNPIVNIYDYVAGMDVLR